MRSQKTVGIDEHIENFKSIVRRINQERRELQEKSRNVDCKANELSNAGTSKKPALTPIKTMLTPMQLRSATSGKFGRLGLDEETENFEF